MESPECPGSDYAGTQGDSRRYRIRTPRRQCRTTTQGKSNSRQVAPITVEVPTVSLHVHERIDPRIVIDAVRKRSDSEQQLSLFDALEENPPIRQAIEFYKHRHNWTNRLIADDSLLVMSSLLEKEGLGGQVPTINIDPPYGVSYRSNFQPFVNRREVIDGKDEDLTTEPEQIRAFRDTRELGIHSYLTYLRDRLLLARELLNESGSCFVQIGDENVHRVGAVMDEVFGAEHRMATISYATTGASSASTLPEVADYLLWYAKDRKLVKHRQLYEPLTRTEVIESFSWHVMVELPDGSCRKPTPEECFDPDEQLPHGARIYRRMPLDSQGVSTTGRSEPYEFEGRTFRRGYNRQWAISKEGLDRLGELGRLEALKGQSSLMWKRYEDEVPGRRINNIWAATMSPTDKRYVVQTANKAIQRCILMTSDPGDLVFDPTCGSGTTAYVAEQWGRRWITCDTSRVAVALAKQRVMTANFDYYQLAHADEGVGAEFCCHAVATVSARTLGYNEPPKETIIYDRPFTDRTLARVTGPFTVEAVRETVARFLEKLDLEPVILHQQPNKGCTIIEKFEDHPVVDFAVVLLTPDDLGALAANGDDLKPRARKNVILELGFFLGKLGRERVCSLVKGDVETPSDYDGVVYTEFDSAGGWKLKLAQELKAAGFDVDFNKAVQT